MLEKELKGLIADIEHTSEQLNCNILSNLFTALDYITALRHWSRGMGGDATCRSDLVYHLKRIGLPLLGQK